ncbi:hypothetical protein ACLOJK_038397 [Asimina triloba]
MAKQPVDGKTTAATTQPPSIQIHTTEQHLPRPIYIQHKQIPISSHGQVETHLVASSSRRRPRLQQLTTQPIASSARSSDPDESIRSQIRRPTISRPRSPSSIIDDHEPPIVRS